jgi:hypothetical protein
MSRSCVVVEDGIRCQNQPHSGDLCAKHALRMRRHSDPLFRSKQTRIREATIEERYWILTETSNIEVDCWMWTGDIDGDGYPRTQKDKVNIRMHVFACSLLNGPQPDGMYALHGCDIRRCVNPNHLYWGTAELNRRESLAMGTAPRGQSHGQAKVSDADVLAIIRDTRTGREIAKDYNISQATVWKYKNKKARVILLPNYNERDNDESR